MKKQLLCITFFVVSLTFYSQQHDSGTIEVIPQIGFFASFLNGDNVEDISARSSFNFGATVDYYFSNRWSLRSGLVYNSMGAKNTNSSELTLNYLNVPINVNWHFGSTRKWNLNFGVTPGFLIKADIDGIDAGDFHESFQLAISYGIGYKLEVSDNFSLLFDGQALLGVTNIIDSDDITRFNAGSGFNIGGVFSF